MSRVVAAAFAAAPTAASAGTILVPKKTAMVALEEAPTSGSFRNMRPSNALR
jgi:hypothetical protein